MCLLEGSLKNRLAKATITTSVIDNTEGRIVDKTVSSIGYIHDQVIGSDNTVYVYMLPNIADDLYAFTEWIRLDQIELYPCSCYECFKSRQ